MAINTVRKGISLHKKLAAMADKRVEDLHYSSFSKYMEALVRDDRDDSPAHAAQKARHPRNGKDGTTEVGARPSDRLSMKAERIRRRMETEPPLPQP